MEEARVTIESTSAFVFTAVCAYLDTLATYSPTAVSPVTVVALRPREPDFALFTLARERGMVRFNENRVRFEIETSPPIASDSKPEPFRQLHLSTTAPCTRSRTAREALLDLIRVAVEQHRTRVMAPRGSPGAGVMRYVWDEDSECWDGGLMVNCRPINTLFLPMGVAHDIEHDLYTYLDKGTIERYQALHIAPVRVYLLHGVPGSGKTSLVHCLASGAHHNLAVLNFRPHTDDKDVSNAIRALPPKCFLCIEDIDCLFNARATTNHGVSFSSLLAALDGTYRHQDGTPLTVFMTTNAIDQLDPALLRRVHYALEFHHANKYQCKEMFAAFFPSHTGFEALWDMVKGHTFSTSTMHKFLVHALSVGDPLKCLAWFQTLLGCTPGRSPALISMYG